MRKACGACNPKDKAPQGCYVKKNYPKDVLDIRIIPGDPSGAWIESYQNSCDAEAEAGYAQYLAAIESQRLTKLNHERRAQLREFQRDVCSRVKQVQKMKREEDQQKSMKAIENEEALVFQRVVGVKYPNLQNAAATYTFNQHKQTSCIAPVRVDNHILDASQVEEKLEEYCEQVRSDSKSARSNLWSKRVCHNQKSMPSKTESKPPTINWPIPRFDAWTGENSIKCTADDSDTRASCSEVIINQPESDSKDDVNSVHKLQPIQDNHENVEVDVSTSADVISGHKDLELCSLDENLNEENLPLNSLGHNSCKEDSNAPSIRHLLQPGQAHEEDRNDNKTRYWKYRKLFMDIEREQVRTHRKREEHRKHINRIKALKERQRENIENEITVFPERTLPTPDQDAPIKDLICTPSKSESHLKRERKIERYMEALRNVAQERAEFCSLEMPRLCTCGPTIWDTHPNLCANNCIFYRNPKRYIEALTTVLKNLR